MALTLISDVHGQIKEYEKIANEFEYTLQIGDCSFHYDNIALDPFRHKIFLGNHDNYDSAHYCPNVLPRGFGLEKHGGIEFFYVRGAFSPDVIFRKLEEQKSGLRTWWNEEELSFEEMFDCFVEYAQCEPKYVFTHTCPTFLLEEVGTPGALKGYLWENYVSKSSQLLQMMWKQFEPELWVFGHFHRYWEKEVNNTRFVCLPELGTLTIDE